jgi:hypothetical protein
LTGDLGWKNLDPESGIYCTSQRFLVCIDQLLFVVTFYMGIFLGLTLLASSPAEASDVLWLMWNGTLPATGKSSLPCLEIFVV